MPLTLEQYATYLDTRDLNWPAAPETAAPRARPHLVRLPELRAVLWNVYGTLLTISSGDLLHEHPTAFIMDMALDKTIQEFNMWASMTRKPGQPSEYLKSIYREIIENLSMRSIKEPETVSERVWEAIVKKLLQKNYKWDTTFFGALNEYSAKIAYFFHASLQGTGCSLGASTALEAVVNAGLKQGLLADAQCFTTVQLQRGLVKQHSEVPFDQLINPGLSVLSCQVGSRKPTETLFRQALEKLGPDIQPNQVLHVGSRIDQDIKPAKRLGMRTALFAGDVTSLKATPEQLKNPASRPDLLLTSLAQIAEVVPSL